MSQSHNLSEYKKRLLSKKKRSVQTNYELRVSDDSEIESNTESDTELDESDVDADNESLELDGSDGSDVDDTDEDDSDTNDDSYTNDDSDVADLADPVVDDTVATLILQYYLRHNLTWVALDELVVLINRIKLMETAVVPKSKYLFRKLLPETESPIYHFYCKNCMAYVGEERQLIRQFGGKLVKCLNCQNKFNLASKTKAQFFVQLKLKQQLLNIFRKFKDNFTRNQNQDDNTSYDDVTSVNISQSSEKFQTYSLLPLIPMVSKFLNLRKNHLCGLC